MVTVTPATVIVPDRSSTLVFAATRYTVAPFPVSLAPALIVIHDTLLAAVHAQLGAAVTSTLFVPPAAVALAAVGATEDGQDAAACVTVNVDPAMVSVPVRLFALVFVATE